MRVLVTGASGFIGSSLTVSLAQAGHDVRAAARHPISPGHARISVARLGDIGGDMDWSSAVEGMDAVVHLAAIAHTSGQSDDAYDRVNHLGTARLARAAQKAQVKRFVFISSIRAQWGPSSERALSEDDPPAPTDAYGRSKLAAEEAVRSSGAPFTILRPVVVYGPESKANMALLLRLCASRWPLPFGALKAERSLLAIDNLVDAVRFALERAEALNQLFIVSDETPVTIAEMIAVLRAAEGRPARLFSISPAALKSALSSIGRGDLWERLGASLVARPTKLMRAGWTPLLSTREALTKLVQCERQ